MKMPKPITLETVALDTLYELIAVGNNPHLEVTGGTVDIYGSDTLPGSPPTGMSFDQEGFVGMDKFAVVPKYLYIEQNTGVTTKIALVGINTKVI